jgi:hypothetical protein
MDAIRNGYTRYTPNAGTLELRKAICTKLQGVWMYEVMNGRLFSQSYLSIDETE